MTGDHCSVYKMNRKTSLSKKTEASPKLSADSPQFAKPFEVFLMRKKKRSNGSPSKKPLFSPLKCLDTNSPAKDGNSFKSPFKLKKTPVKKSQTENFLPVQRNGNKLSVAKSPLKARTPTRTPKRQLTFGNLFAEREKILACITLDDETNLEAPVKKSKFSEFNSVIGGGSTKLPIDWSLKTRIRFVSQKPFPWRGNFRASEDATGTTSFARCLYATSENERAAGDLPQFASQGSSIGNNSNHSNSSFSSPGRKQPLDTSLSAVLRQNSFVWSHPHLPWLNLFPRINNTKPSTTGASSNSSQSTKSSSSFQIDSQSAIADSLLNDWTSSIRSLFHLVKTRQSPYFYMCAPTFTVLFRSAGIAGFDDIHALITPTTSGFRNLLKTEGITFVLPFSTEPVDTKILEEATQASDQTNEATEQMKDEVNPDSDHDDEPSQFLESLGLSQQDFPSLTCNRIKLTKANKAVKHETLAVVCGSSETQLLINFFCHNSRIVVANTGPLSGVPPTLLSPVAFQGGSLQALKLKQTQNVYNGEKYHNLDICGPLLPSAVKGLCEFFKETQDGNYQSNLITHDPTSHFTAASTIPTSGSPFSVFATESLKDCGLTSEFVKDFCSKDNHCSEVVSEIILKDGVFKLR